MTYNDYKQRFDFDATKDLLGSGGFGQVFKAWDDERQCYVALKLAPVRPDMEAFNLLQEYERARTLQHRNIANYLGCERLHFPRMGHYDVAWMQFYEAGHLGQLLGRQPLAAAQKEGILRGILAGLDFLHTRTPFIIHRDLKPANILLVERGGHYNPLITDFGISRQSLGNSYVTNSGRPMSLYFAAPEQDEAEELRRNTDLWSFGVLIAYVWHDGRMPFRNQDLDLSEESGKRQLRTRIRRLDLLPDVLPGLPEPWRTLASVCLVSDPAQRVRSTAELRALLDRRADEPTRPQTATPAELLAQGQAAEARQDYAAARYCYQQAAGQGHPEATYALACLHHYGQGVPLNEARARQLFERAASLGHAGARQKLHLLKPTPKRRLAPAWWWPNGVVAGGVLVLGGAMGLAVWFASRQPPHPVDAPTLATQLAKQMVLVPGGYFRFGLSPQVEGTPDWREPQAPQWRSVASFRLGAYEITNRQWRQLMPAPAVDSTQRRDSLTCADCPVTNVSLPEVKAFLAELNRRSGRHYRLPTDTEWEYAAKGGPGNKPGGNVSNPTDDYYLPFAGSRSYGSTGWLEENSGGNLHPVGKLQPNALGLYDLCGNAEEWTSSTGERQLNGRTYRGVYVRGGTYSSPSARGSVTFRRVAAHPEYPASRVGFRLAEDAKPD